jgi:DinB superfamily
MGDNLKQLSSGITSAIDGMSPDDISRHPEGKWSAAQILEHLNLSYLGTAKNLERCVASGQVQVSSSRSGKRLQRFVVTKLHWMPGGRKSPERALPRGMPPEQVKVEILQNLARMEKAIADCEARFGSNKPIADHPVLGPLTASEWRGFHLTHGRHHLKQILRLKQ